MKPTPGVITTLVAFLIEICLCESMETRVPTHYCTDLNPQNRVDMDQIMGMWFGEEVLTHHSSEEGVFYYDTCVVIHISDVTNQVSTTPEPSSDYGHGLSPHYVSRHKQFRYLRLLWDEKGSDLEYTMRYNISRPGFWISSAPQRGTMLDLQYHQFSGTVQIIKAVEDHLMLTFCHSISGNQLFSVVLVRKPNVLSDEAILGLRTLLSRRGLSTKSVRKVCSSDALSVSFQSTHLLIACVLFILKKLF